MDHMTEIKPKRPYIQRPYNRNPVYYNFHYGVPYMTSTLRGGGKNAPNFWTNIIDFANIEGEGVKISKNYVELKYGSPLTCQSPFFNTIILPNKCTVLSKINGVKLRESFCPAAASHSRPRQAGA